MGIWAYGSTNRGVTEVKQLSCKPARKQSQILLMDLSPYN